MAINLKGRTQKSTAENIEPIAWADNSQVTASGPVDPVTTIAGQPNSHSFAQFHNFGNEKYITLEARSLFPQVATWLEFASKSAEILITVQFIS
jgi:hypothetical protein